ncbi:MAG: Minf_1886 family protein [Planctomycetota bacterium]
MQDASGGFPPEAFQFVREGLSHTVQTIHGAEQIEADESQHVSGQELCLGLRDYALDQYGRLTRMVFRKWGLTETADFGRIVFAMIDAGLMRKTDEDNFDDFVGVYDFDEAFDPRAVN